MFSCNNTLGLDWHLRPCRLKLHVAKGLSA